MALSEDERKELAAQSSTRLPAMRRHSLDTWRRLKSRPPQDREVGEAGIERAREAIRVAQAQARHD